MVKNITDWWYAVSGWRASQAALAKLAPIFRKYSFDSLFDYHFVDENYAQKFALEMLIGKLAGVSFRAFVIGLP